MATRALSTCLLGLLVDQRQIGFDMAVPVVLPIARQRVVAVATLQRGITYQRDQDGIQLLIEHSPMPLLLLPLVVAPELTRVVNRPH